MFKVADLIRIGINQRNGFGKNLKTEGCQDFFYENCMF